jgi:uncharacterized membrane protein
MAKFLTEEVKNTLKNAVEKAEKLTSAEIAICVCKKTNGDAYDAAEKFFNEKELFKTKERNAVLIFLAYNSHKLAILGDEGINSKVPENFWADTIEIITSQFKLGDYALGLEKGILNIGQELAQFFPWTENDENELDDEIHIEH